MTKEKKHFDEIAREYDNEQYRLDRSKALAQIIIEKLNPGKEWEILDFGGGTGQVSIYLQPLVKRITALDNSEEMLNVFQEKLDEKGITNYDLIKGEIDVLLPEKGKYNAIFSTMTFHHIEDIETTVQKLYTIIKPGGKVAILDLETEDGDFHSDDIDIFHEGFDPDYISNVFKSVGFKNVVCDRVYTINKVVASGENKDFPVFMLIGEK